MTQEDQPMDDQDKNNTAPDNDKDSRWQVLWIWRYVQQLRLYKMSHGNMNDKAGILDSSILLDSQSTVDVFMKKNLLNNILKKKIHFQKLTQRSKWKNH